MFNQRMDAAIRIVSRLKAYEDALDAMLAKGGELVTELTTARMEAGFSAVLGQEAFHQIAISLLKVSEARGHLVDGHHFLEQTRKQIGLREIATGDKEKIPNFVSGHQTEPDRLRVAA